MDVLQISLRHGDITFEYNARGQRIARREPGGAGTLETTYTYDEVGNLWRVVLPDGTVVSYRIDGMGRRVARFVDGADRDLVSRRVGRVSGSKGAPRHGSDVAHSLRTSFFVTQERVTSI